MSGFTLLELLITITLITILSLSAAIMGRAPFVKMHQNSAKLDLLNLAELMEDYRTLKGTYEGADLNQLNYQPQTDTYLYSLLFADTNTYQLMAKPRHIDQDDQCGTFHLDQDGNVTITGPSSLADCW